MLLFSPFLKLGFLMRFIERKLNLFQKLLDPLNIFGCCLDVAFFFLYSWWNICSKPLAIAGVLCDIEVLCVTINKDATCKG